MDRNFSEIYEDAVKKGEEVGIAPTLPRVASRQKNKSNNPAQTPEEYFKRNVAIPFLDHIVTNLDVKFDGTIKNILCMINVFYMYLVFSFF